MTEAAPVLPVTVALRPALFAAANAAAASVTQRVEAELSNLLDDLGVDNRPVVQLAVGDARAGTGLIGLFVDGRPCRFPRTNIAEAFAYVDGTPRVPLDPEAVLDGLQGSDGDGNNDERVGDLLAAVCRSAISGQPGILVDETDDAGLHAALNLGMSLAGAGGVTPEPDSEVGDPVERLLAALAAETIDVHIDPAYLQALSGDDPDGELFPFMRDGLFVELGLPLPRFHFRPDPSLRPAAFAFRINALRTLPRIGLSAETILVNDTPERLSLLNVGAEPTLNPASYQPAAIVGREHKDSLEEAGLTTWEPFGFLILSLAAAIRQSAHALMTRDVAARLVQQLGLAFPIIEDGARAHLPPDAIVPILRELLLDGVPIRNMRRILELLLRFESLEPAAHRPDRVGFVRSGLADVIAFKVARGTGTVVVYLLDTELEDAIADRANGNARSDRDNRLSGRLSAAVRAELSYLPATAQVPALLTQDELRRPLRDLLRYEFPRMTVLAYGDLPPECNVQPVARISEV